MKNSKIVSLAYLCLLTVSISADTELNLGPDYPCGSCGDEVLDSDMASECDNCCSWLHIKCQGIGENTYQSLCLETSFSWTCLNCFEINFSHSTNNSFASVISDNHFSILSEEPSPCDERRPNNSATNQIGCTATRNTIKVLNLSCQSLLKIKAEFHALLKYHDPDIVVGTESWLNEKHLDYEYFPQSKGYSPFRRNRNSESQRGRVFILVRHSLLATEQRQLQTDCEIL